jgi:hypothetical protein
MDAPLKKGQQGAAFGPPLLDLKRIKKLTDSAMHMFSVLYDVEQEANLDASAVTIV